MEEGKKICPKCAALLALSEFGKDKRAKDGLTNACKSCRAKSFSAWYAANAEKDKAKGREYREQNLTKERERYRKYDAENREKRNENRRLAAPFRRVELARRMREWNKKNPEKSALLGVVHKSRQRAKRHGRIHHFTKAEWVNLCEKSGNRCLRCNRSTRMSPDHVLPLTSGGANSIDNIQPLCHTCNSVKHCMHIDYRPECEYRGMELSIRILPPALTPGQ